MLIESLKKHEFQSYLELLLSQQNRSEQSHAPTNMFFQRGISGWSYMSYPLAI